VSTYFENLNGSLWAKASKLFRRFSTADVGFKGVHTPPEVCRILVSACCAVECRSWVFIPYSGVDLSVPAIVLRLGCAVYARFAAIFAIVSDAEAVGTWPQLYQSCCGLSASWMRLSRREERYASLRVGAAHANITLFCMAKFLFFFFGFAVCESTP